MSGSVLLTHHRLRGLRGPNDMTVGTAEGMEPVRVAEELIAVQPIAAAALAEGAITEEQYLAYLARADELDATAADFEAAHALRLEVESARISGGTAHRTRVWLMVLVAAVLSILLVGGLAAWAYRSAK